MATWNDIYGGYGIMEQNTTVIRVNNAALMRKPSLSGAVCSEIFNLIFTFHIDDNVIDIDTSCLKGYK